MHIHSLRFMWGNGLLCEKLCGPKQAPLRPFGAVLGLFWSSSAVFELPNFPLAPIWPGSARECDFRAFASAALKVLSNRTSNLAHLAHFCSIAQFTSDYVGLSGCFQEGLLCVFTCCYVGHPIAWSQGLSPSPSSRFWKHIARWSSLAPVPLGYYFRPSERHPPEEAPDILDRSRV